MTEDRADLRVELRAAEPADLDADDPRQALHLRQPRPERVTPVQLVGAVGTDDGQALGPRVPGEERQHVTGGTVGPVQVLDDEEDRDALPERSQEDEQPFEDPRLDPARSIEHVGIGRNDSAKFWHQPAKIAGLEHPQLVDIANGAGLTGGDHPWQAAECLDDRRERQPLAVAE